MRKNTSKKNVIKAMAFGLTASMVMQPVTAFADEGENVTAPTAADNMEVSSEEVKDAVATAETADQAACEAADAAGG